MLKPKQSVFTMECTEFLRNSDNKNGVLTRLSRKCVKLTRVRTFHAGLVACFVPLVICDSEWSRHLHHLSFDEIYNGTSYAQLQHHSRPYDLPDLYSYIPTRSHHITTYSQHVPTHSQNIATQSQNITTHSQDILTHSQNIATYSQNVPSNSQNIATHYQTVPKQTQLRFIPSFGTDSHSLEDLKGNELEFEDDLLSPSDVKAPLLVGFSHDPYRYSVPEEDYLKGVRNMNPNSILSKGENRGKRGVLHLYNMMYCATGCEPLAYKGYGCYCGFLGSGRPTDGIDRCCKMHDECYENIYCPFFTVYFQPYYWKCYKGQPLCALENRHTEHQFINGCAARLCECDRKFAMCVKRYPCPRRRALCRSSPIRLLQNLLMFR